MKLSSMSLVFSAMTVSGLGEGQRGILSVAVACHRGSCDGVGAVIQVPSFAGRTGRVGRGGVAYVIHEAPLLSAQRLGAKMAHLVGGIARG